MKKNLLALLTITVVIFCSLNTATAASVFVALQGNSAIDEVIKWRVDAGSNYTFDVYFNALTADSGTLGIYNVGIDINYNPSIFSFVNAAVDSSVWSVPPSKIIYPGDDSGDYITGDDFGFYVSDEEMRGYTGILRIGEFTVSAVTDALTGEWLISAGDYGPGDDTINYDFKVLDPDIEFKGANATMVPIPSTLLLLGGGLLGLISIGRKRMRKS